MDIQFLRFRLRETWYVLRSVPLIYLEQRRRGPRAMLHTIERVETMIAWTWS